MVQANMYHRARYLAEERLKWFAEQDQRVSDAREKSFSDGLAEGRNMARRATAIDMLKTGATRELVCKTLKLTEAQLTELLAPANPTTSYPTVLQAPVAASSTGISKMLSERHISKSGTEYLDPKIDVIFKMLFASAKHEYILTSFIGAVLNKSVDRAIVLNPKVPHQIPRKKEVILNVSAQLANGESINIVMQMNSHQFSPEQCLYNWAKLYAKQLQRGMTYEDLRATYSIVVLNFELLRKPWIAEQYHSTIEPLVRGRPEPFSPQFCIHTIELPKLAHQKDLNLGEDALAQWGHFLLNPTKETLEKLSKIAPVFKEVQKVMASISAKQRAQHLANQRQKDD